MVHLLDYLAPVICVFLIYFSRCVDTASGRYPISQFMTYKPNQSATCNETTGIQSHVSTNRILPPAIRGYIHCTFIPSKIKLLLTLNLGSQISTRFKTFKFPFHRVHGQFDCIIFRRKQASCLDVSVRSYLHVEFQVCSNPSFGPVKSNLASIFGQIGLKWDKSRTF